MKRLQTISLLAVAIPFLFSCSKQSNQVETMKPQPAVETKKIATGGVSTFSLANYRTLAGVGTEGAGADIKIADINKNGIPDILFMAIDNANGENSFRYKFLMDVSTNGVPTTVTNTKIKMNGMNENDGAAAAIGDIDRNGTMDLVLMGYDDPAGPNNFRYFIGWNLNSNGDPVSWSGPIQVPGCGDAGVDAGMALADVDKNGTLDLVLMAIDPGNPSDPYAPYHGRYKIGFNLSTTGIASSWPATYKIFPGSGTFANGGSLDVSNLRNDSRLYFVVSYYDDPSGDNNFRTNLVKMDIFGNPISDPENYYAETWPGVGALAQGAGVAIGDIDRNGTKDFIQMAYDNPVGDNTFRYYFQFNIQLPIGAPYYSFLSCTCN